MRHWNPLQLANLKKKNIAGIGDEVFPLTLGEDLHPSYKIKLTQLCGFCELRNGEYFISTFNILKNFPGENSERKGSFESNMCLKLLILSQLSRNLWLTSGYHRFSNTI